MLEDVTHSLKCQVSTSVVLQDSSEPGCSDPSEASVVHIMETSGKTIVTDVLVTIERIVAVSFTWAAFEERSERLHLSPNSAAGLLIRTGSRRYYLSIMASLSTSLFLGIMQSARYYLESPA